MEKDQAVMRLLAEMGSLPQGEWTSWPQTPLAGQASSRAYTRIHLPSSSPPSLVVMRLPRDAFASEEGPGGDAPADELPFLSVARLFSERGVRVPRIYGHDLSAGVVLLEDLGDLSLEALLHSQAPAQWERIFESAIDLLADMHLALRDLPTDHIIATRSFDEALLRWELDHFREWGLEHPFGLPAQARSELDAIFDRLAASLAAVPRGLVHRDFQSRNLHWVGGELAVIDFQDAMQGPIPYDLVALLCDSYLDLASSLQETMCARYIERRSDLRTFRAESFMQAFHLQCVQRKLKDAGRFVFIDRVRGNPDFLRYYPQSMAYVARALQALADDKDMKRLDELLRAYVPGYPEAPEAIEAATEVEPDPAGEDTE